jgi:hypothetical protein
VSTFAAAYQGVIHLYPERALADPRQTHVAPVCSPSAEHLLTVVANGFPGGRWCLACKASR